MTKKMEYTAARLLQSSFQNYRGGKESKKKYAENKDFGLLNMTIIYLFKLANERAMHFFF